MSNTESLSAPTPEASLTLTAPEPVAPVAATKAGSMVPIDAAALPELDAKVAAYADTIVALDVRSPSFAAKATDIRTMGDDDIRSAADASNRLLQSKVRTRAAGFADGTKVGETLLELRRTVENLDPKEATGVRKLLGFIPFGDKLEDYFHRYESAQDHLDAIIKALHHGGDELRKDNAALDVEKAHLWETMQRLAQYIYIADHLDASLAEKIVTFETSDPERAKALREDVLFYVRQKHQDLLTQLAVSIQGYLALDMIRKNNIELIKGVDRATTTTVAALRTAVIVAQALANQKLVLDQIDALNTTTSNLIASTSEMLASQSVDIHKQAAGSTVSLEKLQAAFANVYQTMDAIDVFKTQALDAMAATVAVLETEVSKAQPYLARTQRADERLVSGSLDIEKG